MRYLSWAVLSTSLLLVSVTLAGDSREDPELALVNGEPITLDRLVETFRDRHGGHVTMLDEPRLMRKFLDSQVEELLLVQEGRSLELDRDPRVVELVERLERKLRVEALLDERVRAKVVVSEDDIDAALARLRQRYLIRWLRVPTRAQAEAAAERIRNGEPFEQVARQVSIERSAVHGGNPGPFGWGAGPPELERIVFTLEPGETSAIFPIERDFAITRLIEKTKVELPPADAAVRVRVRDLLRRRREQERYLALVDELAAKYGAGVNDELLRLETLRESTESGGRRVVAWAGEREITLSELAASVDLELVASLEQERRRANLRDELQNRIDRALLEDEAVRWGSGGAAVDLRLLVAEDQAVLKLLYNEVLYRDLAAEPADIEGYYRDHADRFRTAERWRIQHLVVADRSQAEELRRRLSGKPAEVFSESAKEFSVDRESAERGGFLDWLEMTAVSAPMKEVLAGLPVGELSEVVETEQGYVLIRMSERDSGRQRPLEEVRNEVRKAWLEQAREVRRKRWVERLREGSAIEVHDPQIARAAELLERRAEAMLSPHAQSNGHGGGR